MNKSILIFSLIISMCVLSAKAKSSNLYNRLDSLLLIQKSLTIEKQKRIDVVTDFLSDRNLSDSERYNINKRLFNEYESFKYDSAFKYVDANINLSIMMGDKKREMLSKMDKVHIISVAGIFDEAEEVLNTISPEVLIGDDLIRYYNLWYELYLFKAEFSTGTQYYQGYVDKAAYYRNLIIAKSEKGSYLYVFSVANELCMNGQYDKALEILLNYLPKLQPNTRRYSIVTSTLSFFYNCKRDPIQRKKYLILSACSDIQACIRENNSIRELSSILFSEGDMEQAFKYLNVSIADANFYGTRLRNSQSSQLIPQIVTGYTNEKHNQQHKMSVTLAITSIIAVLFICGMILNYWALKRYKKANNKAKQANEELSKAITQLKQTCRQMQETNSIKEQYLGRFFELSSLLIERADDLRKEENKLAKEHKLPELFAKLKSNSFMIDSTNLFYQNFDSAFLTIYPNFVDEVNKLLSEEGKIQVKGSDKLTTELRILALIRLGISDNQNISNILRSSITTIYTYRSKLKSRSLYKDDFEKKIVKIYSFQ